MTDSVVDLLIIGAGPAGIAAAAEARRRDLESVVVVDALGHAGGTIRIAHAVRNVPFLPNEATGRAVAEQFDVFARQDGVMVVQGVVIALSNHSSHVLADCAGGAQWRANRVVVATGTRAKLPLTPGLPVRFEPPWAESAPAALQRARVREAAVIGGGDVAFDQARLLRAHGARVTLLCRSAEPRAPRWLQRQAAEEGVDILRRSRIVGAQVHQTRVGLQVQRDSDTWTLEVDAIVAAVGRQPCLIPGMESIAPDRIGLAGDVTGRAERFFTAAMGDGCVAASRLIATSKREER